MHKVIHAEMLTDDSGGWFPGRRPLTERRVVTIKARLVAEPRVDLSKRPRSAATVVRRASEWCCPWSVFSYPGHNRGVRTILGHEVPNSTLCNWKATGRFPVWVAERLAHYIEARCMVGLALVSELREYAVRRGAEVSGSGAHLKRVVLPE